jgi:hypothetical protein
MTANDAQEVQLKPILYSVESLLLSDLLYAFFWVIPRHL